jgi:molybdenum cofactor cytidylyltransferase
MTAADERTAGDAPSAADGPTIVGVLLAAGTSTRFGDENKLLAALDGAPVVRHAAETLAASPVEASVAVVGHDADRVAAPLDGLPIATVRNEEYRAGQGTSVARGAAWAAERDADATVFALGDLPRVAPETYERLLDAAADAGSSAVVVPTYDGERGNPVVFGADHFPALQELDGDAGGRQLFADQDVTRVAVDDPGIRRDVDDPRDLDDLR